VSSWKRGPTIPKALTAQQLTINPSQDSEEDVNKKMKILLGQLCFFKEIITKYIFAVALFFQLVVSVCLLLSVCLRRRWLMLPYLITAPLSLITSVFGMALWLFTSSAHVTGVLTFIITIYVLYITFWMPWRCFLVA
jgi:hypothetical protein